jgi:chemotaxis protein histidine kinase CheA
VTGQSCRTPGSIGAPSSRANAGSGSGGGSQAVCSRISRRKGRRAPTSQALRQRAPAGRRVDEKAAVRETTIRVDTARLDQVLNLSGEIGLTKNRLTSLRADILAGRTDSETLQALDQAVSQLDLLVSDLQNSVMKTRMQPIGRLFQKYPRIARDLAGNWARTSSWRWWAKRPKSTRR